MSAPHAPTPPDDEPPPPPTVQEMLALNLARQRAVESERPLDLTDTRTRRRRDYWISMITANLLAVAAHFVFPGTDIFIVAGVIIINVSLVWVLFFVMDKY